MVGVPDYSVPVERQPVRKLQPAIRPNFISIALIFCYAVALHFRFSSVLHSGMNSLCYPCETKIVSDRT